MRELLILTISFIVLFISFFLFKKASGSLSLREFNFISILFYFNLILETFLGSVLVATGWDNDHYIIRDVREDVRFWGWLFVCYLMIVLPIGILFAQKVLMVSNVKKVLLNFFKAEIRDDSQPMTFSLAMFTIVSISSCIYTFILAGYFPLTEIFSDSNLSVLRIDSSMGFTGNIYIKNILSIFFMPIMSYVWFFYFLKKRNLFFGVLFFITLFFSLSILYYDFSKAPVLKYILGFVLAYLYGFNKFNVRYIIVIFCTVFALLISMYMIAGNSLGGMFQSYSSGPVGRVILGQVSGLFVMLDIFPSVYPHIGGASLSRIFSNTFHIEYSDRAARFAMEWFNPKGIENGVSGVMNSIFIAEAWANWGLLGIILSPLWVGFILGTMYTIFLKLPKEPFILALFTHYSIASGITGGVNEYFYNGGLFLIFICILGIYGFKYFIRFASIKS